MGGTPEVGYVLKRLRPTTPAFDRLKDESRLEGYWMLVRLADGWASGRNKFLKRGEALFGAWHGAELAGVCGLNIDPYVEGRDQGRVRHLFVSAPHRRRPRPHAGRDRHRSGTPLFHCVEHPRAAGRLRLL